MKHKSIFFLALNIFFVSLIKGEIDSIQSDSAEFIFPTEYIDSLYEAKLKEYNVPGSAMCIVKDGKVIYTRGIGMADIENGRQVDPDKTVFRVASISKVFTAMAIFQLIEAGKLKLHQDLRPFIEKELGISYPYPLTLHHIMTHTSGLDYSNIGSLQGDSGDEIPLLEILQDRMPPMVIKPGTTFWYSNYAFGFLGHLIEITSGIPYTTYMKEKILDPLGMHYSTFDSDLPMEIEKHKAHPYNFIDGAQVRQERQALSLPAASSLETTASDMARFIQAILEPSILHDKNIINVESYNLMIRRNYAPSELPEAMGYPWFHTVKNGYANLQHSGGVRSFLSNVDIIMEANAGVFVCHSNRYNSPYFGWEMGAAVWDTLLTPKKLQVSQDHASAISTKSVIGTYRNKTFTKSTFEKGNEIINGQEEEINIKAVDSETLIVNERTFKRIGPTQFQDTREGSNWVIGFTTENGRPMDLIMPRGVLNQYEKISWYQKTIFKQILLGTCLLFSLSGIFLYLFKKNLRTPYAKWLTLISGVLSISFFALLIAYVFSGTLKHGVPLSFKIPMVVMTLCSVLSLVMPYIIYKVIAKQGWKKSIFPLLLGASIIGMVLFYFDLNLIGMKW